MCVVIINIGARQKRRLLASNVLNCEPNCQNIREAIDSLCQPDFQSILDNTIIPYGDGGTSKEIAELLRFLLIDNLLTKSFFDIMAAPSIDTEKVT